MNQRYQSMKNNLANNLLGYISAPSSAAGSFSPFSQDLYNWIQPDRAALFPAKPASQTVMNDMIETAHWELTKQFELMQEFNLEGQLPALAKFGQTPDDRAWDGGVPFFASAARVRVTTGSQFLDTYSANGWYYLQALLNSGHRMRQGNNPIDWAYTYEQAGKEHWYAPYPNPLVFVLQYVRGQQDNATNAGLDATVGWNPTWGGRAQQLVFPEFTNPGFGSFWDAIPQPKRGQIMTALVQSWFIEMQKFSPAEYYAAGFADPNYVPSNNYTSGNIADQIYNMIPLFRGYGADGSTLNSICSWAATVWPNGNWQALKH